MNTREVNGNIRKQHKIRTETKTDAREHTALEEEPIQEAIVPIILILAKATTTTRLNTKTASDQS